MRHRTPTRPPAEAMPRPARRRGDGLLDAIEYRFLLTMAGPAPRSVDGRQLGHGLPRRPIPLHELSAILMHPSTSYAARDAAWRLLIIRARTDEAWCAGALGVALPGLRTAAYRLSRSSGGDVQAAVVEEFVRMIHTVDVAQSGLISKLLNGASSAARAALRAAEPATSGEPTFAPTSAPPPHLAGHPDIVLARAVKAGVITGAEAELIGATRLEERTIAEYADRTGETRWAVYKARKRAEARLVSALRGGALSDEVADLVAESTMTTGPEPGTRC